MQQAPALLYNPGQYITLKSRSSSCYLDGRQDPGSEVFIGPMRTGDAYYFHWVINPCDPGYVSIWSASSNSYLDGRNTEPECLVTNRNPSNDDFLNWEVGSVDGYLTFKCKSNGHYLDERAEAGSTAFSTDRSPHGDPYLQWSIEPVYTPGQAVYIKSKSSNCYLDGRQDPGSEVFLGPMRSDSHYFTWIIHSCDNGHVSIKSVSSNCYLDGRNTEPECLVTDRPP